MAGQNYRDLEAWHRGMDLVVEIYRISQLLPPEEHLGITNQMRSSAVAVPSNIAMGQGRLGLGDFLHYLGLAKSALSETEMQILISIRMGYLTEDDVEQARALIEEVERLLSELIRSLEHSSRGSNLLETTAPYIIDYPPSISDC